MRAYCDSDSTQDPTVNDPIDITTDPNPADGDPIAIDPDPGFTDTDCVPTPPDPGIIDDMIAGLEATGDVILGDLGIDSPTPDADPVSNEF